MYESDNIEGKKVYPIYPKEKFVAGTNEEELDTELKRLVAACRVVIKADERYHIRTLWIYKPAIGGIGHVCKYKTYVSGRTLRTIHKASSYTNKKNKKQTLIWYNPIIQKIADSLATVVDEAGNVVDSDLEEAD